MTDKEKQEWLEVKYPLTIISDRYDGTYSGASWLAFPLYCDEIPPAVNGYDEECAAFWKAYYEPVGKGNSAQSALDNLIKQMHEFKPEESEDERVRKVIHKILLGMREEVFTAQDEVVTKDKALAYLERQKEPHFTKRNALFDKCVANCDPEVMKKVFDEVDERLQKEQKPAEWSEDFGKEVESVHKRYPEVSFAKLTRIAYHFAKWADKYKSTEWSEEEYGRLFDIEHYLDGTLQLTPDRRIACIAFLKSLRPSWKPSEEQMYYLKWFATNVLGDGVVEKAATNVLYSLYEDLKKL